jgi:hypothetical protein
MADDQLQYNTPQDRLLIMLLERVSALEDKQEELKQTIEQSFTKLSSMYVGICVETKRLSCSGPFSESLGFIKNIIKDVFPQCTLYIQRSLVLYQSNVSTVLYLVFETPISLDTVKQALYHRLFQHIDIYNWITMRVSDMETLLQSQVFAW